MSTQKGKQAVSAAAVQNILLTACSLGLGTCWIGAFKEDEVKEVVNAPLHMLLVALISVGYPAKRQKPGQEDRLAR